MTPRVPIIVMVLVMSCAGERTDSGPESAAPQQAGTAASAQEPAPTLTYRVPDREEELGRLQGRWKRGESGCVIEIDGPHFKERCDRNEALLYGERLYTISFSAPGQIRLGEGGSYHNYGYARVGDDVYLGAGAAGRRFGDRFIVAPHLFHALVVVQSGKCWQYDEVDPEYHRRGYRTEGTAIACTVSQGATGISVALDAVSPVTGKPVRFELVQLGETLVSEAVRRGKLVR